MSALLLILFTERRKKQETGKDVELQHDSVDSMKLQSSTTLEQY